jgi:hypothetical protein
VNLRPVRAAYERLVPVQVRRIVGFDLKGTASLARWAARRRDVPPGAVAVGYSREQSTAMLIPSGQASRLPAQEVQKTGGTGAVRPRGAVQAFAPT